MKIKKAPGVLLGIVLFSVIFSITNQGISFPEDNVSDKKEQVLFPDSKEFINLYGPKWLKVKSVESNSISYLDNAFIAKVISYGDPDSFTNRDDIQWVNLEWKYKNNEGVIETAYDAVELAFVAPRVLAECGEQFAPKISETPRQVLERILPLGSRVLAIRQEPDDWGREFFLHLLPLESSNASDMPPNNSVNEMLVKTGAWVPFSYWMDVTPYEGMDIYIARGGDVREYDTEFSIEGMEFLADGYTGQYLDLIIAAGNTALLETVPGEQCRDSFNKLLAFEIKEQEKDDEEYRRWLIEYNNSSNGYCRDGDGDGICYED